MGWVLWFWLWSCNRPGKTLLDVLLNVRIYDPDIPVSSHLYSFAVGLVRDETDVLSGVLALSLKFPSKSRFQNGQHSLLARGMKSRWKCPV